MKVEYNEKQLREIHNLLQRVSTLKSAEVITAFRRAALVIENRVKQNVSGGAVKVRSGRLRNSIGSVVREKEGKLAAYIGSGQRSGKPVVYANILETGGIIRPVKRQWLTIPTEYAKTKAGAGNLRAPEVKNGFFARGKNGSLILFEGGRKTPRPMFILKKQVKIPPKRYLALSLEQSNQDAYNQIVDGLTKLLEAK